MKEFVEKLIGRLEELARYDEEGAIKTDETEVISLITALQSMADRYRYAIEIVNQLAEEYKNKVIIDGQYCFQTCGANEHCKECNRLSNGSIDYYENYDCLAEEYNNGWIPCSERLPNKEEYLKDDGRFIVTDGNRRYMTHFDIYETQKFGVPQLNGFCEDKCVIAWQSLPAPFKKGE